MFLRQGWDAETQRRLTLPQSEEEAEYRKDGVLRLLPVSRCNGWKTLWDMTSVSGHGVQTWQERKRGRRVAFSTEVAWCEVRSVKLIEMTPLNERVRWIQLLIYDSYDADISLNLSLQKADFPWRLVPKTLPNRGEENKSFMKWNGKA